MNEDEVQLMRLSFGPVFVVNNYEITVRVVNFELFTGLVLFYTLEKLCCSELKIMLGK